MSQDFDTNITSANVFDDKCSIALAQLFLSITHERLVKLGLSLPTIKPFLGEKCTSESEDGEMDHYDSTTIGGSLFITKNKAHSVAIYPEKTSNPDAYNVEINVSIGLHYLKELTDAGWEAANNLMILLMTDKNKLLTELKNDIGLAINLDMNIADKWQSKINVVIWDKGYCEFRPTDSYKFYGIDMVAGFALDIIYGVKMVRSSFAKGKM